MKHPLWIALSFTLVAITAWQAGAVIGYRQVERQGRDESFRYSQLISNEVKRYNPIITLSAQHPVLQEALLDPNDAQLVAAANDIMLAMASIVASSDVYLMDSRGHTIAASNYQQPTSFIGQNFSYRPYFRRALERPASPAFYFALGTTSEIRGLYFAHAILTTGANPQPLGVIAMKVQVTELEQQWLRPDALDDAEMLVTDAQGVSFLASRPDWLYRAIAPLDIAQRDQLAREQRYANQRITPLDLTVKASPAGTNDATERLQLRDQGMHREFLGITTPLPNEQWSLRVLVDTRSVFWVQVRALLVAVLLFSGVLLAWLYLRERYRREAELAERSIQLERRVNERTADLKASNQQLIDEVRERKRAETELKAIQQELVQAAKLAVLGQMSAGLNHEMNQPLTAIQTYARNSRRFLERGDQQTVDSNLGEIISLCDKMAELTRQFKVFARKSEGLPSQVDLRHPIDAAIKIINAQDGMERITIDWQRPTEPAMVHGDQIRIEQVMVNLLSNAVQAVEAEAVPRISVQIAAQGQQLLCRVQDNGPGLPANTEQIFEPFFTTKSMKQGLGLGLSISRQIMDALGGSLVGHNRTDQHGAEFVLSFQTRA